MNAEPGSQADAQSWCRQCARALADGASSCVHCGSTRVLTHRQGAQLGLAHIDCDAFYAAIEKRDDPSLAAVPVIIGGGGRRGVVATACYLARAFGVHSAMPMFQARRLCPQAHIIGPDMGKYAREGERLRQMMRALSPMVEPLSIDEAFVDLTGTEKLHGGAPVQTLIRFQNKVEAELGITISIGLSANKFLAKTASDLDKPRGFSILAPDEAPAFLAPQKVQFIHGVGPAFARKLAAAGLTHVRQVQALPVRTMAERFGEAGLRLAHLARGEDTRPVAPVHKRKSVSSETTFADDIHDLPGLEQQLWQQCERAARQAKAKGVAGGTAVLKLKDSYHHRFTRQVPLQPPTNLADTLYRALQPALAKMADGRRFRLIGAGFAAITTALDTDFSDDLLDADAPRRARAERAMDRARARFGHEAVQKGRALVPPKKDQH